MSKKSTKIVPFLTRMRGDLHWRLKVAAKQRNTSANSEIVARLEKSFTDQGLRTLDEITAKLQKIAARG